MDKDSPEGSMSAPPTSVKHKMIQLAASNPSASTLEDVVMGSPAAPWQPTSKFPVSMLPSGVTPYSNRPIPVAGTSSSGSTISPIKTRNSISQAGKSPRTGRTTNNSASSAEHQPHPLMNGGTPYMPDFSGYEGLATGAKTGPLMKTLLGSFSVLTDEIAALRSEVRALRQGEAGSLTAGIFQDAPTDTTLVSSTASSSSSPAPGGRGGRLVRSATAETQAETAVKVAVDKGKGKEIDEREKTPNKDPTEKTFHRPSIMHPTISKSPTLEKAHVVKPSSGSANATSPLKKKKDDVVEMDTGDEADDMSMDMSD